MLLFSELICIAMFGTFAWLMIILTSVQQTGHNFGRIARFYSAYTHTRLTALFPGLPRWAGTRKVKTNLDFTEARDREWQWHQLGHTQVCTSLQTDNHASTPRLVFYRPDALPAAQPTASKHWRHKHWRHTVNTIFGELDLRIFQMTRCHIVQILKDFLFL